MRTNAHPTILTGARTAKGRETNTGHNVILDLARDLYDGHDAFGWAMDLLYAVEVLRMQYDSPRIGGGIEPALATNLPDLETARADCSTLGYIIGAPDDHLHYGTDSEPCEYFPESMGELDGLDPDYVQDCIVHAEAVADRLINMATLLGTDY